VSDTCLRPLSEPELLDWWADALDPARRRSVEEHLLGCGLCSARLATIAELDAGVREIVRTGQTPAVVTGDVVERLRREGRTVREYRVPAGGGVLCTVAPHDQVMVTRLSADLHGASRIDLVVRIDDAEVQRLPDIPFDPAAGELVVLFPIEEIRASPAHVQVVRLLAMNPGGESLLGEYTFDHAPWPDTRT